jgi:hypothetical protein
MQNAQSVRLGIAPQYTGTWQKDADAANAGSKAVLDAIMGTANLALKASGIGGFGPASFGSSFGSSPGPGTGPTYANANIGAMGGVPFPIIRS